MRSLRRASRRFFVPFPAAADDHQNVNARALERVGAAVVVEESNLGAAYLVDTIAALIGDSGRLQSMSAAAKSLAHPKAVEEIAEMVARLGWPRVEPLTAEDAECAEKGLTTEAQGEHRGLGLSLRPLRLGG